MKYQVKIYQLEGFNYLSIAIVSFLIYLMNYWVLFWSLYKIFIT
jgi:hypothetical protein